MKESKLLEITRHIISHFSCIYFLNKDKVIDDKILVNAIKHELKLYLDIMEKDWSEDNER